MKLTKVSEFCSIVLIGSFNPLIFHPYWLKENKLISQEDINTNNLLVHQKMSHMEVGNWMRIDVSPGKCEYRTDDPSKIPFLIDLTTGCLKLLHEDPIVAFGINYGGIYDLQNKDDFYLFGNRLHGLEQWNESFKEPRLRTIVIEDNKSELLSKKSIIIKSSENEKFPFAIDMSMNFHYQMPDGKQKPLEAVEKIGSTWRACLDDYKKVFSNVQNIANHV